MDQFLYSGPCLAVCIFLEIGVSALKCTRAYKTNLAVVQKEKNYGMTIFFTSA